MRKRRIRMIAWALALIVGLGIFQPGWLSDIRHMEQVKADELDTIYTTEDRYYQYRIIDEEKKTVEIVKANESGLLLDLEDGKAVLNIPSEINGYTVVSLGDKAFIGCTNVEVVHIPNTVTNIGYRCFYRCIELDLVTLTTSVTSIGASAFTYTPWLLKLQKMRNGMVVINGILIDGRACTGDVTVPDGGNKDQ